ncbi:TonB-dependent siderophore receptor [Herbaspirillum rubrisubalbicans]|uniref:Ligand-gated channel protein n=1 Tax=Herbaspirillum rubrisubalbicans TaxID=80842 RepID=A0ABX9BXU7_9BURK|nr:TonB-dependent siderophore receptor [Herbaspirillum rubrisubalbicans]RAM62735.1 ligand-gated channel protein [Herbaspirillum rubrisubalbicans]
MLQSSLRARPCVMSRALRPVFISMALAGCPALAFAQSAQTGAVDAAATASGSGQLPTVTVSAGGAGEGTQHLQSQTSAGALGSRSLLDTPFSVTSITAADIADKQLNKLGDLFYNEASVSDNSAGYSAWASYITIRGLPADWQNSFRINGKPFLGYGITLPYDHFERIDLLKGSAGFMYGFGSPGGVLNYLTKKPTDTPLRSISVGYTSNNIWSEHVDLGGRFGKDHMFGYRLNVTHDQGETFNEGHIRRNSASLALDGRLTRELTWDFQAIWQNSNSTDQTPSFVTSSLAGGRLPSVVSGSDKNLAGPGQHLDTNFQFYQTGLTYRLNPDWKANLSYSHSTAKRFRNEAIAMLSDAAGNYSDWRSDSREGHTFDQWQAMLEGNARTGSIDHQLVLGASWQKQVNDYSISSVYRQIGSGNLYAPNTNAYFSNTDLQTYHNAIITQQAVFASDTLNFSQRWSLLAGGRYNQFKQDNNTTSGKLSSRYDKSALTPTLALMFKPERNTTLYTSYVESLEQGGVPGVTNTNYGSQLKPLKSRQYEIGAKTDQQNWSATAALFRIERASEYTLNGALVQNGQSNYQGLELGAAYRPTPQWQVGGSLMLLDAKYDHGNSFNGNRVAGAPRNMATAQVAYLVPQVAGLKLSADAKFTGSTMARAANDIELASYTLFNLGASYTTRIGQHDTTFRAAVNNVLDKRYWQYQYENYIKPGDPRTFSVSAKVDF